MILELPADPETENYEMELLLDGVSVVFGVQYNERDDRYYLSLYDPESVEDNTGYRPALLAGIPILVGQNLLAPYASALLPPGYLTAIDTESADRDPGRGELGARVKLLYIPLEDLEALAAENAGG